MPLCAYQTSNNNEHVIYVGVDKETAANHVYELIYTDDKWACNDLTKAAVNGAPAAAAGSTLAGYRTSNNNEHVIFEGVDKETQANHIYELIYTGGHWACNDLTKVAVSNPQGVFGAPAAVPGSALVGYQTSNNNEHVIFEGVDKETKANHVYELIYAGGQWACNDLTEAAKGAPPAAQGSALAGYQTSNNDEHVIFINTNVYELIYAGGQWVCNDLTKVAVSATAFAAVQGSGLAGYQSSNSNEHVIYVGTDAQRVDELVYTGFWAANNDLGGPPAAQGCTLAGYQSSNNNEHVNYVGFDQHVHELVYADGQWHHTDLTTKTGAPNAVLGSGLAGFQTYGLAGYQTSNNELHVNYLGVDQHVHELVYANGQWHHTDLTSKTGGPNAVVSN